MKPGSARDNALKEGTTVYRSSVKPPGDSPILKPGANNRKLGGKVLKGEHAYATLFQLSLEERATCPTTCQMWDKCYGNNMPFAHRIDHRHPEFEQRLRMEVIAATMQYKKVLVRLHVLGDFYNTAYVRLWGKLLAERDNLAVFGYTANMPWTPIGEAIDEVIDTVGWSRFAVRYSGLLRNERAALVGDTNPHLDTFWCPEQEGKVPSCAACGACWNGEKTVRFKEH